MSDKGRFAPRLCAPLVLALVGAAGACDELGPRICTADFRYGLTVRVVESVSGAALSADSVSVSITEGAYGDSITVGSGVAALGVALAGERAGTYVVRARATGYLSWDTTGVRVTADECHVQPVALTARMVSTSPPAPPS